MFRPNQMCLIRVASGRTDVYGQSSPSSSVREPCAVVRLIVSSQPSTVRADSSASRGAAEELVSDSIILLGARTAANIDDVIEISGTVLRIVSKHPRFNIKGGLDHYEITAAIRS